MTAAEVRENLPACELSDSGLDRIIADIEAEIEYRYGDNVSKVESFDTGRVEKHIYPARRVESVTSIVEIWGTTEYTLSVDDYELVNGIRIDRKPGGTNSWNYYGDRVVVTYVPQSDQARREMVIVDLVKLTLAYSGVDSEKFGDYSMSQSEYQQKREEILSRLGARGWA